MDVSTKADLLTQVGTDGNVINLTADISLDAQLTIATTVTIHGNGHTLRQTGTNARVISINTADIIVSMDNLIITGGNVTNENGGGMRVYSGTANVINCTFAGNTANSGPEIYNGNNGTLNAINTVFWHAGTGYIYNGSTLNLYNCAYGANAISGTAAINQSPVTDLIATVETPFPTDVIVSVDIEQNYGYTVYTLSLDVSGCAALTSLDVSSGSLETLNVSGCENLASLNCASNDLGTLDLGDCANLRELNCSENSLLSLDLSGFENLIVDCHGQHRYSLTSRQGDGNWTVLWSSTETLAKAGTVRAASATGLVAESVKAYDADGVEIAATWDAATGTFTFPSQPERVTYNDNTGYNDGTRDVLMDVTLLVEEASADPEGPISGRGSSSGCETGFGALALVALLGLGLRRSRR